MLNQMKNDFLSSSILVQFDIQKERKKEIRVWLS